MARLPRIPRFKANEIRFRDQFVTAKSHANWFTRWFGKMKNCIDVTVTEEQIWMTSGPVFEAFVMFYDLEHVIPLREASIQRQKGVFWDSFKISYVDPKGTRRTVEIWPWNADAFQSAVANANPEISSQDGRLGRA